MIFMGDNFDDVLKLIGCFTIMAVIAIVCIEVKEGLSGVLLPAISDITGLSFKAIKWILSIVGIAVAWGVLIWFWTKD